MLDRLILLGALLLAFTPGAALAVVAGVRSLPLVLAVAPSATIGLLALLATVFGFLGIAFGPVPVGVVTAALVVGAVGRWWGAGHPFPVRPRRPLLPLLAGLLMTAAGLVLAVRTWLRGFGGLDRIAQEHDMITHQLVVAYVMRTGEAAPWQIQPADLLTGGPVSTYPSGGHLGPALLAGFGPGPVAALNAFTVVHLAVCWVLGTAVLTLVAARQLGSGRAIGALAAGVAAVVAPALYRPAFQLMHDGGVYPNAVTLALAPGLLAGFLLAWRARRASAAVLLGFGSAGIVATHPSGAVTVAISVLAWLAGDLVYRRGRTRLVRLVPVLAGTAVVAAAVALPLVLSSTSTVSGVAGYPPDSAPYGFGDALGSSFGLGYGGYLDGGRTTGQAGLTILCLAGVLAVARVRRGLGLVAAWAVWVGITFTAMLSPGTGVEAPVTGFFYNAMARTWSHVSLFVPTLAALAVVLAVAAAVRVSRRHLPTALRSATIASVAVLLCAGALAAVPVRSGVETNTRAVAARYAEPDFVRVGPDDLAAVEFLRDRVAPGERVLNSANDGSTFLYVEAGIPVVNTATLGTASVDWSIPLLRSFRDYPHDPAIRELLHRLDVGWVYVDEDPPGIGASGAPYRWVDGSVPFTVPPGLEDLDARPLPGLTKEFQDGAVSVYRLDLDRIDQRTG